MFEERESEKDVSSSINRFITYTHIKSNKEKEIRNNEEERKKITIWLTDTLVELLILYRSLKYRVVVFMEVSRSLISSLFILDIIKMTKKKKLMIK